MKALTIHQPYASLIAKGLKKYETRSWATRYRGPLAIHASKTPIRVDDYPSTPPIKEYTLPLGKVIAFAYLADCVEMTPEFIESISGPNSNERAFGDWRVGRFAWKLEAVVECDPIPAKGRQRLWNFEPPDPAQ